MHARLAELILFPAPETSGQRMVGFKRTAVTDDAGRGDLDSFD